MKKKNAGKRHRNKIISSKRPEIVIIIWNSGRVFKRDLITVNQLLPEQT